MCPSYWSVSPGQYDHDHCLLLHLRHTATCDQLLTIICQSWAELEQGAGTRVIRVGESDEAIIDECQCLVSVLSALIFISDSMFTVCFEQICAEDYQHHASEIDSNMRHYKNICIIILNDIIVFILTHAALCYLWNHPYHSQQIFLTLETPSCKINSKADFWFSFKWPQLLLCHHQCLSVLFAWRRWGHQRESSSAVKDTLCVETARIGWRMFFCLQYIFF